MSILFINACVRPDSRTLVLARDFMKNLDGPVVEVDLNREPIAPLNRETLALREQLVRDGNRSDPFLRYANQFAQADQIVIAAPFWDLSFPAILKAYLEQITVAGITFEYRDCRPVGLCKAKRLTYVTTSGGPIFEDFGYSYVKSLAKNFYGIPNIKAIRATNLDVDLITADTVLTAAEITEIE